MHAHSPPLRALPAIALCTVIAALTGCSPDVDASWKPGQPSSSGSLPSPHQSTSSPSSAPSPAATAAVDELVAPAGRLSSGEIEDVLPQLAMEATARRAVLVLPAGRYTVSRTIVMPVGTHVRLEDGALLEGDLPGVALVRVASGTTFSGGTITNTSSAAGFDMDLAEGSEGVTISGVTFRGASSNAFYMSTSGLKGISILGSTFDTVSYGILLNPGSLDAEQVTIRGNRFVDACADAIEINAATSGTSARVKDVVIAGNHIRGTCGAGDTAGFGIGLAGVDGFEIRDNTISGARNEAIHLEDGTTGGTVVDNTISDGGSGTRPAVAIYRTTARIVVESNTISRFAGAGVAVLWDSMGSAKDVTVDANVIDDVTGNAVVVAGDHGTGPFRVTRNRLTKIGGDGVSVSGSHELTVISGNRLVGVKGRAIVESLRGSGVTRESGNQVFP